jgi:SpoIID/LytB domain protein
LIFFILAIVVVRSLPAFASIDDEIASIGKQLEDLKKSLSQKEANRQALKQRLENIAARIGYIQDEIQKKENEVKKGEAALAYQQKLLDERARSFYKNAKKASFSLINIFVSDNLSVSVDNFFYQKTVVDQDKNMIIKIVLYIKNLEETKRNLENEKNQLAALQQEVDQQTKILEGEIAQTRQAIAQLTAKQQELIAKKFSENKIPRSAGTSLGGCSPDYNPWTGEVIRDPGFSPKFGFFSLGVDNKTGLNQYGARGRAILDGQTADQILRAYYNFDEYRDIGSINIKVNDGNGINQGSVIWEGDLEEYLKRLGEMPDYFPSEALKAQVIAARSYALAVTNFGQNSICATENCQVFLKDVDLSRKNNWVNAVNDTKGKTMFKDGQPIKAWYSSTHGGVILRSEDIGRNPDPWTKRGFDMPLNPSSLNDMLNNAYDRESPWFYCNWGSRSEYNNSAWLKESEVLEIVNALILFKKDVGTFSHLSQVDKNLPDTWDDNRVREEIRKRGESYFSRIDYINVAFDGSGISRTIVIKGDIGERTFNAQEFKDIFNIRARGNLVIVPACLISSSSDVGRCKAYALFDVVKK